MVVLLAAAAVGSALLLLFEHVQPDIQRALEDNLDYLRSNPLVPALVALALAAPLFGFGAFFWRYAGRVRAAARMPPPGEAVIRDTPVRTGSRAINAARLLQLLAMLLLISGLALPAMIWALFAGV